MGCIPETCFSGSSSKTNCTEAPFTTRKRTHKTKKKQEEGRCWGYSMDLKLYDDPWKIKKKLKESDLGHLNRLLLSKELVLPVLGPEAQRETNTEKGTKVMIWDIDTKSIHHLVLKFWVSSGSYVFIDSWTKDFVNRRDLKKGDEIGFHWDPYKNCFDISVLLSA